MISVIIPAYNAEKTIEQCLKSLLDQTYKDFELIVVNDGSKDATEDFVATFNNPQIKLIRQPNGGVSSARNRGLKEANGDYICFVDADDYVDAEYLNQLAININDCDIVCGKCAEIVNDTLKYSPGVVETLSVDALKSDFYDYIQKGYVCSPWMKLFKNSVIKKFGLIFNRDVSYGEDFMFVMNYLSCVNQVKLIDKPLYFYVRREGTISTGFRRDIDAEYAKLSEEVRRFLGEKHRNQAILYEARAMKDALIMLYRYYRSGMLRKQELSLKIRNISEKFKEAEIKSEYGLADKLFFFALKRKWFSLVKTMLLINSKLN